MKEEKRIVVDSLGHKVELWIDSGLLCLGENYFEKKEIQLNKIDAEILHAFISLSLKTPRDSGRREILEEGKVIELANEKNPRIIIHSNGTYIEIHPASWEPLMYEVALLLPRMSL